MRWKLKFICVTDIFFKNDKLHILTRTDCGDTIWGLDYNYTLGAFYCTIYPCLLNCDNNIQWIPSADLLTCFNDTWLLINTNIVGPNKFKLMFGQITK